MSQAEAKLPMQRRPSPTIGPYRQMAVMFVLLLGQAKGQSELPCRLGQYEVRMFPESVMVSTTVFATSLVNGTQQANSRIINYFKGANDKNLKMKLPDAMVTQTYISSSAVREVTVGFDIPRKHWKNPPIPTDDKVVIDVIPSTIFYARRVQRQKLGTIPDKEAAKHFSILKEHDEPVWSDDDYYYFIRPIRRNGAWTDMEGLIFIFATNEKVDNFYQIAEGHVNSQLRRPKCLRDKEIAWPKSSIPVNIGVERKSCRENFCNDVGCPSYELTDTLDSGAENRRYRVLPAVYNWAATCSLQQSSPLSQPVIYHYLRAMGVWRADQFQMFDQNLMTIYQRQAGPRHCQKKFKSFTVVPREAPRETVGRVPYKITQFYPNRARRVNYWRPKYYVKCFGGNGDGDAIFDTAGKLAAELDDMGVCRRRDHFHVGQYNRQSRILDRHNEIWFWDDKCRSLRDNAPNITFEYVPVREERQDPDLGNRCVRRECPEFQKVRTFDGFIERFSPAKNWNMETDESHTHTPKGTERPPCIFPFVVDGQIFHNCTYHKSHRPWCAWDAVFAAGHWSYCDEDKVEVKRFDGVIKMTNMTYSRDLTDSSTVAFRELASRVERELSEVFSSALEDFVKLTVTGFLDDEINVEFLVTTTRQSATNVSYIIMAVNESLPVVSDGNGGIVFDSSSLHVKDNVVFQGFNQERICTFPFTYKGIEYDECVTPESGRPWCAWDEIADEERATFCDNDDRFVCTTVTTCGYQSAKGTGMSRLLSYFNGNNDGGVTMDTTLPVLVEAGISSITSVDCGNEFDVCLYLPTIHQANPPHPNDDKLTVRRPLRGYSYSMSFGKFEDSEELRSITMGFVEKLARSRHFEVQFDGRRVGLLSYDSGESDSQYNELVFKRDNKHNGHVSDDDDDNLSKTCEDSKCVLFRTKEDHGEFTEMELDPATWVCTNTEVCGDQDIDPVRRRLHRLMKYFKGENDKGVDLGEMGSPVFDSKDALPTSNGTSRELCRREGTCVPVFGNVTDVPKPTDDKVYFFNSELLNRSFFVSMTQRKVPNFDPFPPLAQSLDESGKAYGKEELFQISYGMQTPDGQGATYFAYWKKDQENENRQLISFI